MYKIREETARANWIEAQATLPLPTLGYSPDLLRTTSIDVQREAPRIAQGLSELRTFIAREQERLVEQLNAREWLEELGGRSFSASSSLQAYVDSAMRQNVALYARVSSGLDKLERRERSLVASYADICEELTRRLVMMEEYEAARIHENREAALAGQSTSDSPEPSGPQIAHAWQEVYASSDSETSVSPRTLPPSYPGSPHESDEYYSADEREHLVRIPHSVGPDITTDERDDQLVPEAHDAPLEGTPGPAIAEENTAIDDAPEPDRSFGAQALSQRIEHLATVRRPRSHPTRAPGKRRTNPLIDYPRSPMGTQRYSNWNQIIEPH
ncbi:hypothetical protein B0H15DRAFT_807693 [Mycena belliarum]|uniref:Uncharacterized protein n=1 Tax=Mycena belliarum TaxID=1033014 RepID=A0AAD6TMD4_9AGAR|nr:hypothetical protein B0H15DRAFT_807693 [Mycena belliae]